MPPTRFRYPPATANSLNPFASIRWVGFRFSKFATFCQNGIDAARSDAASPMTRVKLPTPLITGPSASIPFPATLATAGTASIGLNTLPTAPTPIPDTLSASLIIPPILSVLADTASTPLRVAINPLPSCSRGHPTTAPATVGHFLNVSAIFRVRSATP